MTEEIHLSDAEKRLLRRVFHRHALPYIGALGLVTLIAISGGSEEAAESKDLEPIAATIAPSVDVEALLEAQGRAEQLLAELQARSEKRAAEFDAANRQIAALEKRLGTTARRLAKVEGVARQALEAAALARAKPPTAPIGDKLLHSSSQEAQTRPVAVREVITLPAAPANASVPMDLTP